MPSIRVLVVDDSLTIRAMLEQVLGNQPDVSLVGSAADARTALRMVREHHPDVVTVDIGMPDIDGLALLDAVQGETRVVMLSSHREAIDQSFDRGALGFFDKKNIPAEAKRLVRLIRAAAEGRCTRNAG